VLTAPAFCLPAAAERMLHCIALSMESFGLGARGTSLSMNLLGWIESYQKQMVSTSLPQEKKRKEKKNLITLFLFGCIYPSIPRSCSIAAYTVLVNLCKKRKKCFF